MYIRRVVHSQIITSAMKQDSTSSEDTETDSIMTSEEETDNQEAIEKLDAQIMNLVQDKARLTVQADPTFRKQYRTKKQVKDIISFKHSRVQ
jgi:phosphoribosylaminoimidazole carboxylase (NCAIR synthetase)